MAEIKTIDEKQMVLEFLSTFNLDDPEEKKFALKIINYIIRQLNNDSLRGYLFFADYKTITLSAVEGLFKEIYVNNINFEDRKRRNAELMKKDVIFASSMNFLLMLMTRVNQGRDRELIIKELESRRPVNLMK